MRIPFGFFAGANRGNLLVMASSNSPYIHAYPWLHGFGTKYANPGTIRSAITGMDVHPNGNSMAAVGAATPYLWGYTTDFSFSGNLTVPSVASFAQQNIRYSLDGNSAILSGKSASSSGLLHAFSVGAGGTLTTVNTQGNGSLSSGYSDAVFTPDATGIFSAAITSTTWGIRYHAYNGVTIASDSKTNATGSAWSQLEMHPNGGTMLARRSDGVVYAFPVVGDTLGTPYAPASALTATHMIIGGANNDVMFIASASTPFIEAWPMSGGTFGTKYANPSFLPSAGTAITFNAAQSDVVIATSSNPIGYPWSNASGFGTKYADPATSAGNGTKIKLV